LYYLRGERGEWKKNGFLMNLLVNFYFETINLIVVSYLIYFAGIPKCVKRWSQIWKRRRRKRS
jgi:hypothetical protein